MTAKKKYLKNFRYLIPYRKALLFRKSMYSIIKSMPSSEEFIKDSIRKASSAVIANLAEGNANYYFEREYQHYDIALCKLAKCQALLDLVKVQSYINEEIYKKLQENGSEIRRLIISLMDKTQRYLTEQMTPIGNYQSIQVANNLPVIDTTIFEKTQLFQLAIKNMVRRLPEHEESNVSNQLIRAISSVFQNLTKSKDDDFSAKRFLELNVSLGSLVEVRSFLDMSVMENYITRTEYDRLDKEAGEIQTMLIKTMVSIDSTLSQGKSY